MRLVNLVWGLLSPGYNLSEADENGVDSVTTELIQ